MTHGFCVCQKICERVQLSHSCRQDSDRVQLEFSTVCAAANCICSNDQSLSRCPESWYKRDESDVPWLVPQSPCSHYSAFVTVHSTGTSLALRSNVVYVVYGCVGGETEFTDGSKLLDFIFRPAVSIEMGTEKCPPPPYSCLKCELNHWLCVVLMTYHCKN